jgi:hypothetical protein
MMMVLCPACRYVDEDYLDDEGGQLVGGVLSQLFREVLSSVDLKQTLMKDLRTEERCPFFAELKPDRPPYELLAETLGVGRKDHYLVQPEVSRSTNPTATATMCCCPPNIAETVHLELQALLRHWV